MDVSKELRYQRKKAGLTLEQLAERAKMSKAYLWQLENQPNKSPSAEMLYRISRVLHFSLEEFFTSKKYCQKCGHTFENDEECYFLSAYAPCGCEKCVDQLEAIRRRHNKEIRDWFTGRG